MRFGWRGVLAVVSAPILSAGFMVAISAPGNADAIACNATPGNLVTNCGFETGDFQGWTQGGPTGYTSVASTGVVPWFTPHTGTYGVLTGESTEATLSQSLATEAGQLYDVGVWLRVKPGSGTAASDYVILEVDPDGSGPAGWGSPPLVTVHGPGTESYVQYTGSFTAGGPQSILRFRYVDSPDYWFIDDVTVVARPQQPDGLIRKPRGNFIGNNIYNTTAYQQTVRSKAHRTDVRKFGVRVFNDGSHAAKFTVKGTNSPRGVRVQYFSGGVNVTTAMKSAAGLSFTASPGDYKAIQVRVTIGRHAAIGFRKFAKVTASWTGSGLIREDAVRAVVRVVR